MNVCGYSKKENLKLKFTPLNPVGYFDMIELLKHCAFVITDSGGLQKESFFFEKHCLIIRDETEWTELVELGYNFLVGSQQQNIIDKALMLKAHKEIFNSKPYGKGNAAKKIVEELKQF